ncbi:MAG: DUF1007 family protein [Pseudomonadota bacterium]|nr:DUF1007 family protein [Pseudomonadota bacterium]
MLGPLLLGLLCIVVAAGPVGAHPHVWIEARSDVVFNDVGQIVAINHEWTMDEMYSATAVEGLDGDGDGTFSPSELEPLTRENIESLKEYGYFTHMMVDGKPAVFSDVVETGQRWNNKRLKLHFQMPLKEPVDPLGREVFYRVYDPEFFISIEFAGADAVAALGGKPEACSLDLRKPAGDQQAEDTRTMLATKGVDWQPPPEEEFGAMFAQPITILCK